MSTNPENTTPSSETKPVAPAPRKGRVKKIKIVRPAGDDPNTGILWLAVLGEVLKGLIGVGVGAVLAIWGCVMIKDGIKGDVAFTVHFGEHNSLDINTGVVGLVIALIGVAFVVVTAINIEWTTSEKQTPADNKKAGGA
jgi:hypothetical protein